VGEALQQLPQAQRATFGGDVAFHSLELRSRHDSRLDGATKLLFRTARGHLIESVILRIASGAKFVPGIYHYSNEGQISWFDFAVAIKELTASACQVNPIPSSQYPTPAKRPHYSLLDKGLIKKTYGITIPEWKESLITCLDRIRQASSR